MSVSQAVEVSDSDVSKVVVVVAAQQLVDRDDEGVVVVPFLVVEAGFKKF